MNNDTTIKRVPCRGCIADCIYYSDCDGHLWRLTEIRKNNHSKPDENVSVDKSSQ